MRSLYMHPQSSKFISVYTSLWKPKRLSPSSSCKPGRSWSDHRQETWCGNWYGWMSHWMRLRKIVQDASWLIVVWNFRQQFMSLILWWIFVVTCSGNEKQIKGQATCACGSPVWPVRMKSKRVFAVWANWESGSPWVFWWKPLDEAKRS